MLRTRSATTSNATGYRRLAFALLAAMTVWLVLPASAAYAKDKKTKAAFGIMRVRTAPGGYPLEIDGKPQGQTSTTYQEFQLEPGLHTVVVALPSGRRWSREINVPAGRRICVDVNYRPPTAPLPKSPCPYPVNLSAPSTVNEGDVITFAADVAYSGTASLNYTWTVSPAEAKLISGAGTPTITVDSTGLGGRRVTATLVVNDGSGEAICRQTAQASTQISQPPPPHESPAREFDVCCTCSYDDQKARLDNLAIELANDPSTKTYIIAYSGRASRAGTTGRLLKRANDYLIQKRSVDQARIVTVNGGYREEDCVELWLVPSGAQPPKATPTIQAGEAQPASETPAKKRRRG